MDPAAWPSERGRRSSLIAQFGTARTDLLQSSLTTGDPLADAVVEAIHRDGRAVNEQLTRGLKEGLASVENPHDAVAALLGATETLPDYATDELLDTGSLAYFTMPNPAHIISLSAGALIRVYESPSIAEVLTTTGRLIEGADRRLKETGKWVTTAMLPGSLRPGADGYVATVQVRMLHAHMRHVARTRGFDEAAYGAPINQVDLARTWMDFTLTMFLAEEKMGLGLTSTETATMYRYWWVIAHILGVDPDLVEGIQSNDQAKRVDDLLQAVTGPLIPQAADLASATLNSIKELLHEAINVPEPLGAAALRSLARRFHGDAVADELGLRRSRAADRALDTAISGIRSRRASLRRDPDRWASERTKQVQAARELLADGVDPLYETHRPE